MFTRAKWPEHLEFISNKFSDKKKMLPIIQKFPESVAELSLGFELFFS